MTTTPDGWQVEAKPSPPELDERYEANRYGTQEPLRADTDEWLALIHRLSDKDRAALSTVVGIVDAILDNNQE